MESISEMNIKQENVTATPSGEIISNNKKWGCSVCGEETWCGTDGCPLDPQ